MRRVIYRPRASFDVQSTVTYVGEVLSAPQAAKDLYEKITHAIALLAEMPDLGKPFLDRSLERQGYRSYLIDNYRILYSHSEELLVVWRIVHTRQDIDDYALVDWNNF